MNILQSKSRALNEDYYSHIDALDSLNAALHRELPLLAQDQKLDSIQVSAVHEYINDRGTVLFQDIDMMK